MKVKAKRCTHKWWAMGNGIRWYSGLFTSGLNDTRRMQVRRGPDMSKDKMVSQPGHYADSEIECIDAMVAAFGQDKVNIYAEIAAFKYIWRMDKKNEESKQDKQKAVWYLRYSIGDDPRTQGLNNEH